MNSPIGYGYQTEDVNKESLIQRLQVTIKASKQDKDNAIRLLFEPSFLETLSRLKEVSYPDYVTIKEQSEKLVPANEFRKAVAQESRTIAREAQANAKMDIPTLGETLGDVCPKLLEEFRIPFGWWVSKDGLFKSQIDRFGNTNNINICRAPIVTSGVHTDYETGELKLELMFYRRGKWISSILNRDEALNHQTLQPKTAKNGSPVTSTNSKDIVSFLAAFEAENEERYSMKNTVSKIGWLPEQKLLVTSNGIYSSGKVVDSGYVYQPMKEAFQFNIPQSNDWKEVTRAVLPQLLNLNQLKVTLPVIGWFFVAAIAPFIRKKCDNQFPILTLWGKSGSGKTTLTELFMKVTGNPNEPQKISTPYALTVQLSSSNTVPVVFDEYKPAEMTERTLSDFHNKAKLVYRGDLDSRGKPGGVTYYPLIAPLAFIGEDYPRENQALVERSVTVQLERSWIEQNKEAADAVCKSVLNHDLEAVSNGFWQFIFHYLEHNYLDADTEEASRIAETFEATHFRTRWNTTVNVTGMLMYQRMLKWLDCEVSFDHDEMKQAIMYTLMAVTEDHESVLDRILLELQYDHQKFSDADIFLDQEQHLLYVTASLLNTFVTTGMNSRKPVSKAQFKYELEYNLKSDNGYVGYDFGKGKAHYIQKKIKGRNGWRYVFDTLKLEEITGISEDSWLSCEPDLPEEASPTVKRCMLSERSGRLKPSNRKTPS